MITHLFLASIFSYDWKAKTPPKVGILSWISWIVALGRANSCDGVLQEDTQLPFFPLLHQV